MPCLLNLGTPGPKPTQVRERRDGLTRSVTRPLFEGVGRVCTVTRWACLRWVHGDVVEEWAPCWADPTQSSLSYRPDPTPLRHLTTPQRCSLLRSQNCSNGNLPTYYLNTTAILWKPGSCVITCTSQYIYTIKCKYIFCKNLSANVLYGKWLVFAVTLACSRSKVYNLAENMYSLCINFIGLFLLPKKISYLPNSTVWLLLLTYRGGEAAKQSLMTPFFLPSSVFLCL